MNKTIVGGLAMAIAAAAPNAVAAEPARPVAPGDAQAIYDLDTEYQAAVKRNDADGMAKILADDFVLIVGRGTVFNKADLLKSARDKHAVYERQDESQKTVRMFADNTGVVTALLWIKGVRAGQPIDYKLWYSDVYVKRQGRWWYVLGQASLRLPEEAK